MIIRELTSGGRGVIILTNEDSVDFGSNPGMLQSPTVRVGRRWAVAVRPEAVAGLADILVLSGVDLARARAEITPVVREISSLQVSLDPRFERTAAETATAPNVVAVLEGSDPTLKRQYVIFSAHMDHRVAGSARADSLDYGADDNASGIAALIEMAKAYSQPGARPKRSLAFVATSGSAKGLWGSYAFADRVAMSRMISRMFETVVFSGFRSTGKAANKTGGRKTRIGITATRAKKESTQKTTKQASADLAPFINIAANINLNMIGRGARDSVTIDGVRDLGLALPAWIAAAHPDLRLTAIDGGTAARPRSDHFAFIRQGIPSLFFHGGVHDDRPATDLPAEIDPEQTARIARLAFFVGHDIANTGRRPKWTAEGRRHYLESLRE